MKLIKAWEEVPNFHTEKEEYTFWQTHELDAKLMAGSVVEVTAKESTTITLRFDPRMLSRIKRVAGGRFLNYQSMIKQWLAERMEEETRKS